MLARTPHQSNAERLTNRKDVLFLNEALSNENVFTTGMSTIKVTLGRYEYFFENALVCISTPLLDNLPRKLKTEEPDAAAANEAKAAFQQHPFIHMLHLCKHFTHAAIPYFSS